MGERVGVTLSFIQPIPWPLERKGSLMECCKNYWEEQLYMIAENCHNKANLGFSRD